MQTGMSGNTRRYLLSPSQPRSSISRASNGSSHFAPPDWLEPSLERGFGRLEVLRAEPDWRVYPESVVSPLERSSLGRAAERDGDASLVRLAVLCSAGDEGLVPD